MNINYSGYTSVSSIYRYFYSEEGNSFQDEKENSKNKYDSFFTEMGKIFESKVIEYLSSKFGENIVQICKPNSIYGIKDIHLLSQLTTQNISSKTPIIYSAPIFDSTEKIYGIADLIIRKDFINQIFIDFPKSILDKDKDSEYIVADIKWKRLDIIKDNFLSGSAAYKAYKSQVYLYSKSLSNMCKISSSEYGLILGKGSKYTKNKINFTSNNPFEIPGLFNLRDPSVIKYTLEALLWIRGNSVKGNSVKSNSVKSNSVKGNSKSESKSGSSLSGNKRKREERQERLNELNLSDNLFSFNLDRLKSTFKRFSNPAYVDFEFLTPGIFDDFTDITNIKSEDYVFMIGIGHEKDGEWKYDCFMCDKLDKGTERMCFSRFINFLISNNFDCVYYYDVEKGIFGKKAVEFGLDTTSLHQEWVNVKEILVSNNFIFKDCNDYKLKNIAKALENIEIKEDDREPDQEYNQDYITFITSETKDGMTCMFEMYKMYKSVYNQDLVQDMLSYNNLDCKYLHDIIKFIEKK